MDTSNVIDFNKPLAAHVAEFVATPRYSDVPSEMVHTAKKYILDTIGVGLAGSRSEVAGIVRRYVEQLGCGAGAATVLGTALRVLPRFSALANGRWQDAYAALLGAGRAYV